MRGDNFIGPPTPTPIDGSPPRAWGQWQRPGKSPAAGRFTPTCVGTIDSVVQGQPLAAVHPHVRGDNRTATGGTGQYVGSPPRAWGQCTSTRKFLLLFRFTPTCVGTMLLIGPLCCAHAVHPHVRGDNILSLPPDSSDFRFTPTCVGTIVFPFFLSMDHPVHPHVRGDNYMVQAPWNRTLRFTPTCVGTISLARPHRPRLTVHPHVRGDNGSDRESHPPPAGSPHVRGDNSSCVRSVPTSCGSPPRAWGQ